MYREKDAKEIDIVLEHDGVLNLIEIKENIHQSKKHYKRRRKISAYDVQKIIMKNVSHINLCVEVAR